MDGVLGILSATVAASPGAVSLYIWWMHRRVSRIERHLWPAVFGGDK